MPATERPLADYAERNAAPILAVLDVEFAKATRILEIGSGTGQHAARFAAALPQLTWQPSDLGAQLEGIRAWVRHAGLANLLEPLTLDVRTGELTAMGYDGVFSANTAHIMDPQAVERCFSMVANALLPGGRFCLYGPFRRGGAFNTPSNAAFDARLRQRDASMGIRDLEALDALAADGGLSRVRLYAMPANNHLVVWEKTV